MAIPTVRSVGTVSSGTGAVTPGAPAGTAANDILVLVVETANQNLPTNPPTGWTTCSNLPAGTGTAATATAVKLHVFWRRLTGAYTAVSIGDSGNHTVSRIMAIQGCITSGDPWDVTAGYQSTASTALSFPSVTTTDTDRLIVLAAAFDRDANTTANLPALTNGNLTSITERMDNLSSAGVGGGIGCATAGKATAGATGTTTGTITSSIYHTWTGALIPAPPLPQQPATALWMAFT